LEEKEEQLINMGNAAEKLLGTEVFTSTINAMVDGTLQSFGNTKPEESDVREQAYYHYRALVDLVGTLQQRVSIKNEILAKNAEAESDNNGEDE
jgi:hypothetical protein